MVAPLERYFALDVLSAILTFAVVVFFSRVWRKTGQTLHLLFAVGFFLVAASFLGVSTSQFDLREPLEAWDALRISGQLGGSLVLAFAYMSARVHGSARPAHVLAWSIAALSGVIAVAYWVVPPVADFSMHGVFPVAHALMIVAYATASASSAAGFLRQPTADRALVPLAFLGWAMTKYTWLLADITEGDVLAPFVYAWRFAAIGCLLLALALPPRLSKEVADAAP